MKDFLQYFSLQNPHLSLTVLHGYTIQSLDEPQIWLVVLYSDVFYRATKIFDSKVAVPGSWDMCWILGVQEECGSIRDWRAFIDIPPIIERILAVYTISDRIQHQNIDSFIQDVLTAELHAVQRVEHICWPCKHTIPIVWTIVAQTETRRPVTMCLTSYEVFCSLDLLVILLQVSTFNEEHELQYLSSTLIPISWERPNSSTRSTCRVRLINFAKSYQLIYSPAQDSSRSYCNYWINEKIQNMR